MNWQACFHCFMKLVLILSQEGNALKWSRFKLASLTSRVIASVSLFIC